MSASSLRLIALALLLGGCATSVPPGPGVLGSDSVRRQQQERSRAHLAVAEQSCATANAQPADLRMQRKCAELARGALNLPDAPREEIAGWVKPVLPRLAEGPDACGTREEAARLQNALGQTDQAATLALESVHACSSATAALDATRYLRTLDRCPEAVAAVATVFAGAPQNLQVPLLDAVASCSNEVSLRQNLSFAPPSVVQDYFGLLEARRRQEEEDRRRAEAEERQRQAEQAAWQRQSDCQSDCAQGGSQCESGCAGDSYCISHCQAAASMCRSGCH